MDIILKRRIAFISIGIIASIGFLFCAANNPFMCFVAACGVLVFLISLRFKEKVFFAFIFLYPLIPSYFAFDLGGALPLVKISRLLVFYVILFDLLFNREKFRKIKNIVFSKEIKIISFSVLFLIFTFIQNYFTYPDAESLKILISFVLEEVLIAVYFFFRAGSTGDVDKAVKYFLFAAFFIAITGIIDFVLRVNFFSYLDIMKSTSRQVLSSGLNERLGENRIEGPFGHPLAYCNYLLMAIPMGIYKWQTSKEIKVKTLYLLFTLIMFVNIFLTLSRGPILSFFIGLFFYFIFTDRRSKQIIFMLVTAFSGLMFVGLVAGALPGFIRNYLVSIVDSVLMRNTVSGFGTNGNASTYRLYLFELARKLVTDNYIWIGRGMSFFRLNEVYDWVPGVNNVTEVRVLSIDNFYILKYIEMGLLGLISHLMFIFSLIYSCLANLFKKVGREFILCFLFIFISYFISLFMVDEIGTFRFLWIITGILLTNISLNQAEGKQIQ